MKIFSPNHFVPLIATSPSKSISKKVTHEEVAVSSSSKKSFLGKTSIHDFFRRSKHKKLLPKKTSHPKTDTDICDVMSIGDYKSIILCNDDNVFHPPSRIRENLSEMPISIGLPERMSIFFS